MFCHKQVLLGILLFWSFQNVAQTTTCFNVNPTVVATCPGKSSGSIALNITGGIGPFSVFVNGSTIALPLTNFLNLPAGTYSFRILDTKNDKCVKTLSLTVLTALVPKVSISGNSNFCPGQSIGLTANLESAPPTSYSYVWSNGQTGNTINFAPSSAGTYSVTVTDPLGCSVSASKSISQVSGPSVSFSGNYTNCPGTSVTLIPIISGGSTPYSYIWDGVSSSTSSKTVNPSLPKTYCLTVRDANNCTGIACVTVNQRVISVSLPTGISVCQGSNYTLSPTVSNASGTLTYKWNNGSSGSSQTILVDATQTHAVTVTDGSGCSGSASTSIGMVSNPVIPLPSSAEVCQANSLTLDTKLSASSHTFRWSTGSTTPSVTLNPTSSSTASVTVTNTNKCQSSAAVTISVNPNPVVILPTTQSTCANTPFSLTPAVSGGTPGYTYLWNDGTTTATLTKSFSSPSALSIKVADNKGCFGTANVAINLIPKPTVSVSGIFEICPGQSTTLTALPSGGTGPFKYKWNTGDTLSIISVKPSNPTTYNIIITDKNNCVGESNILVSPTKTISVSLPPSLSICLGDSALLKPFIGIFNGDLIYNWSNNLATSLIHVKPTTTSKYSLTIKDNLGCTGFAETIINVNQPPDASLPQIIEGCIQDSVTVVFTHLKGASPFSYSWSNGSSSEQPIYFSEMEKPVSVTVTDVNRCKSVLSSRIKVNERPVLQLNATYTFCENEKVILKPTISGGLAPYTYNWSDGSTLTELNTRLSDNTNVSLRISDVRGCKNQRTTSILINKDIPKISMPDTLRSCIGKELLITPNIEDKTGIKSYIWSDGQTKALISKKVLQPVTMRLQVINLLGCMAMDSVLILPFNNPSISLPEFFESCKSNKISIEIPGPIDNNNIYTWSNGVLGNKNEIIADTEKLIKVYATNREGCRDSASTWIKILKNPLVNIVGKPEHCSKSPASFTVDISSGNAPYSVKWGSGETTLKVDFPGMDSIQKIGVEVTDNKGCKTLSTLPITIIKGPEIQISQELFVCENKERSLLPLVSAGKKPYLYSWNTGETNAGIMCKPGRYLFQVTDANGCISRKNIEVLPLKVPEMFISFLKQPSCNAPNGQIRVGLKNTSAAEIIWSNGSKGDLLENAYPGKYTAAALDANQCLGEISQNLICNCDNKVGLMDGTSVSICKNELREGKYNAENQFIGQSSSRWFIMHNSPGVNIGNQILYTDTVPVIKFVPGMAVGETYYFSAVIGRKLSNGSLDLNDICLSVSSGTPVKINPTPDAPSKIAVSDSLVCPGTSIILQTNKQEPGFTYKWKTPRGSFNTLTPSFTIAKFEQKDIGAYFVSIGSDKCNSNLFGPISIQFSKEINEIFTEPDKTVCGRDSVLITGNKPGNGIGKWLTSSAAKVNEPEKESTMIKGLVPGINEFFWSVITKNCIVTDTLKVYYVPQPKLKNDTVNLDDTKNSALFDFLENDDLGNIPPSFLKISLVSKPVSGNMSVSKEGFFSYSRDPNISEDQSFVFTYEVCNTDTTGKCSKNCDRADVVMNVTYNPRTLIYPTIGLRPNFNNPVWKFEAARPMYRAEVSIVDRWGKVVFKEDFLELQKGEIVGSWNGLSQNQLKLPAGAYFFSLIGEIENNEKVVQNGIIYLLE
jgi:hypothetical protein